jgi:hypothetical protein
MNNPLGKPVSLLTSVCLVVILILLVSNVFFIVKYFGLNKELIQTKITLEAQKTNTKVLDFTKLFIDEVLKADTEINFDTRLKLETAVRGLNDQDILTQWQKFTDSKAEGEAQLEVKNLLEVLVQKIKI